MKHKYPYFNEVNFVNDFNEIPYNVSKALFDNRLEMYEGLEYPFEFISYYNAIAVIDNCTLTIYFNSDNDETKNCADAYALIRPNTLGWIYLVDAIVIDGIVCKM